MKYDYDKIVDRKGTNCDKHDKLNEVFGVGGMIPLWVADTDIETPKFVTDAIIDRLSHPVLGYSFRDDRFFNSIINWVDMRNGWKIEKEWIGFSPGVVSGLAFSLKAVTSQGDKVLIQPPVYKPFFIVTENNNREIIMNDLKFNGEKWEIDFEDFEKKIREVKAFILCNPHNPTGRVFTKQELLKMGELCVKHNVTIISDEIHSDLTLNGNQHINIASLSKEIADLTITIAAPSKTFNIAALATSYTIIPNLELRTKVNIEMAKFHIHEGNLLGAVALQAAFENGAEWVEQFNSYISDNMDYVIDYIKINMPKIKAYRPEATFLMWLDFSGLGLEKEQLKDFMYTKAKLALNHGTDFGDSGDGYMRLNVGSPRATISQALEQLHKAYIEMGY